MRKIKEVLRLHYEARLSEREIANICALGKGTVRRFLQRAEAAEVSWPLPPALDDTALEKKLFPPPPPPSAGPRPQPEYATIHKELRGPNITLQLLWEEYKQAHPTGYGHSRFSLRVGSPRRDGERHTAKRVDWACGGHFFNPSLPGEFQLGGGPRQAGVRAFLPAARPAELEGVFRTFSKMKPQAEFVGKVLKRGASIASSAMALPLRGEPPDSTSSALHKAGEVL